MVTSSIHAQYGAIHRSSIHKDVILSSHPHKRFHYHLNTKGNILECNTSSLSLIHRR
uniref:Uncharacterized protein n=1 Tax=Arundo donax TaxID=35708 RepID=A0A0A9EYJ1_ARUDO